MHLIVGIDTGKTLAYACLDLSGNLVGSAHKASHGVGWLIDDVGKLGVPSVITCDREPNDIVRKVAAAFNSRLVYPKKELSISQKRELTAPFGIRNPHERDACSAAIKAYNSYANKLKQAERIAKGNSEIDLIKAKIIEKHSIEEAISKKEAHRR
ncbi:MAG: DUF460 domain-containing protein [Candidatus Micrarchaeales archaeon]|nr:DUF460 domain-containing protein [Candidatus Micrarchaeales archaeon]